MKKIVWIGGPLDGCEDLVETPTAVWIGPDVTEPSTKYVVYSLFYSAGRYEYRFDQHLTDHANAFPESNLGP